MDVKGVWNVVSARILDAKTMEMMWVPATELMLSEDEMQQMIVNTFFSFEDDGVLKVLSFNEKMLKAMETAPKEEIDAAIASGMIEIIDDTPFMVHKQQWKIEGDDLFVNDGSEAEVFGEKLDPWKKAEAVGNTFIINESYQVVKKNEEPTEIKKTVKPTAADLSPETAASVGTYKGLYTKMVCSEEKETKDEFKLVINPDGTGTSYRDDLEIKIVKWVVTDGKVEMTEKFLGTIDYMGTLDGNKLSLFNGDPEKPMTYEYVYEKE